MKKILLAMASILAFTACGSNAANTDIIGKWNIESAMGVSTENAENRAFIEFTKDGEINGNASVNYFNGSYKLKGETLTFGAIGMTKMMGASMDIEDLITEALNSTTSITIDGDTAIVKNSDGLEVMALVRAENVAQN